MTSERGLMEFAAVDKAARSKMGVWTMQEWTYQHDILRVDIAGIIDDKNIDFRIKIIKNMFFSLL